MIPSLISPGYSWHHSLLEMPIRMYNIKAIVIPAVLLFVGCGETPPPAPTELKVFTAYFTFFNEKTYDPEYAPIKFVSPSTPSQEARGKSHVKITEAYLAKVDKSEIPVFQEWKRMKADAFSSKFGSAVGGIIEGPAAEQYSKLSDTKKADFRKQILQEMHAAVTSAVI
jgi:hypothetical protein